MKKIEQLTDAYCFAKIRDLGNAIRNKQKGTTTLFLACYETFPSHVWGQSVEMGLLTPREFQACMIALKQYRKLQAKAAIEQV
jgi:hypothetical protein